MYCIIDLETSGYSSRLNAVCQLAAIIIDKDFNVIAEFNRYVKPYSFIGSNSLPLYDKKAEAIHGLTKAYLFDVGDSYEQVIEDFITFYRRHKVLHIIGHNYRVFDAPFLAKFIAQTNINFAFVINNTSVYDTMEMAWKENYIGKTSLKKLCLKYNIPYNDGHNAFDDCMSTLKLFKIFKR